MTARFSLWEDIKIQSQYFPHIVSFFHFILDLYFRSTRHYLAVKIFEWVFIFLQLLQVRSLTQFFSLFLLPFLKQPLKREDGTEATAKKNVLPIEGGWKNNTPGCQSFLAIRLLDKDRAWHLWAFDPLSSDSQGFRNQDYKVQTSANVFKSSDAWAPEFSSSLAILTIV